SAGAGAVVDGLDLVDGEVAGPVQGVEGGAGDGAAVGRGRAVDDAGEPGAPPGLGGGDLPGRRGLEHGATVRGGPRARVPGRRGVDLGRAEVAAGRGGPGELAAAGRGDLELGRLPPARGRFGRVRGGARGVGHAEACAGLVDTGKRDPQVGRQVGERL